MAHFAGPVLNYDSDQRDLFELILILNSQVESGRFCQRSEVSPNNNTVCLTVELEDILQFS